MTVSTHLQDEYAQRNARICRIFREGKLSIAGVAELLGIEFPGLTAGMANNAIQRNIPALERKAIIDKRLGRKRAPGPPVHDAPKPDIDAVINEGRNLRNYPLPAEWRDQL